MSEERKYLTRDEAKADALYEVESKGRWFQCRKVSVLELFADGVLVPPIVDVDMDEAAREAAGMVSALETLNAIQGNVAIADAVLARTMVNPKLWRGSDESCPDDAVTLTFMGPHRDNVINGCLERLGYGGDRRKAVDFRDPDGPGEVVAPNVEGVGSASAPTP